MYQSLQKLQSLPDETLIYCAHEYTEANLAFAKTIEPHNQTLNQRIIKVKALRQQNLPSLPSTLSEEKATNPFLRCTQPGVIQQASQLAGRKLSRPDEVFAVIRKAKDCFTG